MTGEWKPGSNRLFKFQGEGSRSRGVAEIETMRFSPINLNSMCSRPSFNEEKSRATHQYRRKMEKKRTRSDFHKRFFLTQIWGGEEENIG